VLDDADVDRVLVVTAHPDDVDFGCAGTIAQWTDRGIEVTYCVVTDGDAGGFDERVPRAEMPAIRRAEQAAAAAEVGVSDVRFLGYADGRLEVGLGLRRDIARVIRDVRPQRAVVQSPMWSFRSVYRSHPDHRAAGEAAMCAVYPDARNPFAFTELLADEGLRPWSVPETWIMVDEVDGPPHVVDVTETFARKLAAIRAHASQLSDPDALEDRIRGWLADNAARHGLPEGRLAETFTVVPTA
jgi:LmbE family N-acetylglucosaminyl deacetylase